MGLIYMGQRDHGTTRIQGPIGVETLTPPAEEKDQRGPAGMQPPAIAPLKEQQQEKYHVQSKPEDAAPAKAPPPDEKGPKVAQKKKQSWIEFHVVREKTQANVPGVTLHVVLPDGNEEKPLTGNDGKKMFKPIDPGTCELKEMSYRHLLEVVSLSSS